MPTCIRDGFINNLKQHSKLGVHCMGLLWMHTEHSGIKSTEIFQFAIASGEAQHSWEKCLDTDHINSFQYLVSIVYRLP